MLSQRHLQELSVDFAFPSPTGLPMPQFLAASLAPERVVPPPCMTLPLHFPCRLPRLCWARIRHPKPGSAPHRTPRRHTEQGVRGIRNGRLRDTHRVLRTARARPPRAAPDVPDRKNIRPVLKMRAAVSSSRSCKSQRPGSSRYGLFQSP